MPADAFVTNFDPFNGVRRSGLLEGPFCGCRGEQLSKRKGAACGFGDDMGDSSFDGHAGPYYLHPPAQLLRSETGT
jgi:hypothetical protein